MALGPVPDGIQIDRNDRSHKWATIAEGDRFGDERAEFELVLDELRRERGTIGKLADILGAVDDDEMAPWVEKAGIASVEPAILGDRLARDVGLLVVTLEYAGRADQHLAVFGDTGLGARNEPADCVGVGLAVGLQRGEAGKLGLAPYLFYVHPEVTEEPERLRA